MHGYFYPNPPPWAECDTRSIFKRSMYSKGVHIQSFPSPTLVVLPRLNNSVCLSIYAKVFVQREMQKALSRIWNRVIDSISYDDNSYGTTSLAICNEMMILFRDFATANRKLELLLPFYLRISTCVEWNIINKLSFREPRQTCLKGIGSSLLFDVCSAPKGEYWAKLLLLPPPIMHSYAWKRPLKTSPWVATNFFVEKWGKSVLSFHGINVFTRYDRCIFSAHKIT